jgi:putative oligomerization/nucleic acid binding protein
MSRGRRRTVKALVVLGSVLAFLSVFAIWTERQALNTDDWVDTSDRLIQNSTIRTALGNYLADQLYENVDVEREIEGILPSDLKELAGPASGGLRQVAGDGADQLLKTSTAQSLWQDANRAAHEQLIAVLEDKKEAVSTEGGEVTLNLGSLVTNLAEQVGIGADLAQKLPPDAGQITILRSDQLKTAQNIAVAVKGLALILTILTLASFAAAIYLSRDQRWVTILFCGIGLIAAGFAVIVARQVAGGIVVGQLVADDSVRPAADAAWSISTSLMTSIATTVIVFGVLFAIAGWLGSPTGSARATRRFSAPVLRDYAAYVYAGLAIVVCIYFLSAPTQNLRSFLTTLMVAAFAAFGIHELRKETAAEFPDAEFGDTFGGAKERMVGAVKDANLGEKASKLRLPEMRKPSGEEAPTATLSEEDARLERLERLAGLHEKGVLTDEEFATEKSRVLGGAGGDK